MKIQPRRRKRMGAMWRTRAKANALDKVISEEVSRESAKAAPYLQPSPPSHVHRWRFLYYTSDGRVVQGCLREFDGVVCGDWRVVDKDSPEDV